MKAFILFTLFAVTHARLQCRTDDAASMASLFQGGKHYCEGALISPHWVLAPAHCYAPQVQVRLGETDLTTISGTEQLIDNSKIIVHPRYNRANLDNDIMLIKLSKPAILNTYVKPLALPSSCTASGSRCLISTWTKTNGRYRRCDMMSITSDVTCKAFYHKKITPNMICAAYSKSKINCQSPTGGVMKCHGQLHGLMSLAPPCDLQKWPVIFTKVCQYIRWLKAMMAR